MFHTFVQRNSQLQVLLFISKLASWASIYIVMIMVTVSPIALALMQMIVYFNFWVFIMSSQYNWNITLFGSCDLDCTCIARLETRSTYYGYRLLVGSNLAICHHLLWYKCRYKLAKLITIIFIIFLCCTYILGGMVIFLDVSRIIRSVKVSKKWRFRIIEEY